MKVVDDETFAAWAQLRNVVVESRKPRLQSAVRSFVVLEIPGSAAEQMNLAGELLAMGGFNFDREEGLWITLWGIWNDWNRELGEEIVVRIRSENGLRLTLEQASAQIMEGTERKLTVALLCQIFYFRWDAWVLPPEPKYLIECSHDGLIWITCESLEVQAEVLKSLSAWKPIIKPMLFVNP
jgi:hypothetical protein